MNADDLKIRTKKFSLRCMKLAASLPRGIVARAIAGQLVRAGTSVGANYRAACRARSKAEFVAKLGIVEEESNESVFWMELIIEDGMMPRSRVEGLMNEAEAITKIIVASIRSARPRISSNPQSAIRNPK